MFVCIHVYRNIYIYTYVYIYICTHSRFLATFIFGQKPRCRENVFRNVWSERGITRIHPPETRVCQKRLSEAKIFLKRLSETLHISSVFLVAWR